MRPLAPRATDEARPIRQAILEELRPVALKNCRLKRYGSTNDGGYLLCENLIAGLEKGARGLAFASGLAMAKWRLFPKGRS